MALENLILDEVSRMIQTDKKIEKTLLDLLKEHGIVPQTRKIAISARKQKAVVMENQHFKFESVLKTIGAGINLALVGPAGSGKTSLVHNVATALHLEFYSKSVSAQTGIHEFFGYYDASGRYIPTLFRKAYEKGGVFLLDEFDAGNPNVLAALNQATANGSCAFPDKMVAKHKDFVIVMAGNTFGTGANAEYVGRNKIDAATLDRFMFMEIPYDETLEMVLAEDKDWCEKVQKFRKNAELKKVKCIISSRATFHGEALLATGMTELEVVQGVIYKGLSEDEIKLISDGIKVSNKPIEYKKPAPKVEKKFIAEDAVVVEPTKTPLEQSLEELAKLQKAEPVF